MTSYIQNAIQAYGSTTFLAPATQLPLAFLVNAQPVPSLPVLTSSSTSSARRIGRWPTAIFDFPGLSKPCPNTGSATQYYLSGSMDDFMVPDFDSTDPSTWVSTLSFFNTSLRFAHWKVEAVEAGNVVQAAGLDSVNVFRVTELQV